MHRPLSPSLAHGCAPLTSGMNHEYAAPRGCRSHRTPARAKSRDARCLSAPDRRDRPRRTATGTSVLRQSRARLRRLRQRGQGCAAQRPASQPRDHHRQQRHAVGTSALRALPGADPPDRPRRRLYRAGRRRRAGDVRWRHAGATRHAAVPVFARPDCDGHRRFVVARHVRWRAVPGHLRQDRAGPADRRTELWSSAQRVHTIRPDAQRHSERAEIESAPGVRGRQGQQGRAARSRSRVVSRPRYLHLLRHRQLQPDADGDHGPAPARRQLHRAGHTVARRTDCRRSASHRLAQRAGRKLSAGRPHHRRARDHQRRDRPARHRRLHQPPAASGGDCARRWHPVALGRFRRAVRRDPAAGAGVSERLRRRKPVP